MRRGVLRRAVKALCCGVEVQWGVYGLHNDNLQVSDGEEVHRKVGHGG